MKALAVCATYGRIPYLGRMLSSFLHQTYDDKHLVVINDDSNIEVCCAHKDVTVLNCNRKLRLSEKRNIGATFGLDYDIIFPWDDDDVYLPLRLSNHMEKYEDPNINAYRNLASYTIYDSIFESCHGSINSKSYRKDEWFRVYGYQCEENYGEDLELYTKLQGFLIEDDPDKRDYVYNFSGVNYHLASRTEDIEGIAFRQLQDLNLIGKKFWINPDFEQYNNFLLLDSIYKKSPEGSKFPVNHISDAKIDISHLL